MYNSKYNTQHLYRGLRNKAMSKKKTQIRTWGRHWLLAAGILAVLVGVYIRFQRQTIFSTSAADSDIKPQTSRISPYDAYVQRATKKGWMPIDPIEKLRTTIAKFGQVLDPKDIDRASGMLKLLVQEYHYIIKVLRDSTDREFDLTPMMFDSLEMLKIAYFKSAKDLLRDGASTVTRATVDVAAKEIRILHIVLGQVSLLQSSCLLLTFSYANALHADIASRDKHGSTLLMTAVRFRLYSIIPFLLDRGASFLDDDSITEAVVNGDSIALALLLSSDAASSLVTSQQGEGVGKEKLLSAIAKRLPLAETLNYVEVKSFLSAAIDGLRVNGSLPPDFDYKNDYLDATSSCQTNTLSESDSHFRILLPCSSKYSTSSEGFETKLGDTFDVRSRCNAPVYELKGNHSALNSGVGTISLEEFKTQFVDMNRPVIIRGLLDDKLAGHWGIDNLVAGSGDIEVHVGQIPYEPLFEKSMTERLLSLREYIEEVDNGLKRYPSQLSKWLMDNDKLPANDIIEIDRFGGIASNAGFAWDLASFPLPAYVFDNRILSSSSSKGKTHTATFAKLFSNEQLDAIERQELKKSEQKFERTFQKLLAIVAKGQFFIGPVFSGAPFHYHGPALNALVKGEKMWLLMPPGKDLYSKLQPLVWSNALRVKFETATNASNSTAAADGIKKIFPYYFEGGGPCSMVQILNLKDENIGFAVEVH